MASPGRSVRWALRNLTVQGFSLTPVGARRLSVALRFSTGVYLPTLIAALAPRSAVIGLALASVCAVGAFAPFHPFDLVWDYGVRHPLRVPAPAPNPPRRRRAWKVTTILLLAVAALLAVGATAVGVTLGVVQVLGFAAATSFNLCIPSELVARREGRSRRAASLGHAIDKPTT